jgi:uncharacterized membrane protein
MAQAALSWLFAIPMLGFLTGLRSMTPMAVLCWFAYAKQFDEVQGTWAEWTSRLAVAIVFTVLAVAELVADKLPKTPNRTSPGPLMVRLLLGALIGAIAAIGVNGSSVEGGFLSAITALAGAFCGYHIRNEIVDRLRPEDWQVAIVEDALTVALAIFSMGIITS